MPAFSAFKALAGTANSGAGGDPASETFTVTEGSAPLNFDGFSDGSSTGGPAPSSCGSLDVGTIYTGATIHLMGVDTSLGSTFWLHIEGDVTGILDSIEIIGDTTLSSPGSGSYDATDDHTEWYLGGVAAWDGSGTTQVKLTYA